MWMWSGPWRTAIQRIASGSSWRARPVWAMTSAAMCPHCSSDRMRSCGAARNERCHTGFAGAWSAASSGSSRRATRARKSRRPVGCGGWLQGVEVAAALPGGDQARVGVFFVFAGAVQVADEATDAGTARMDPADHRNAARISVTTSSRRPTARPHNAIAASAWTGQLAGGVVGGGDLVDVGAEPVDRCARREQLTQQGTQCLVRRSGTGCRRAAGCGQRRLGAEPGQGQSGPGGCCLDLVQLAVAVAAVDAVRAARTGVLTVPLIRMASCGTR